MHTAANLGEVIERLQLRDLSLAAIVRPGDTLLLQCETPLSEEQAAHVKKILAERFSDQINVVILAGGLTVGAVHRPED